MRQICRECTDKHLRSIEAFERSGPQSLERWEQFWEKNIAWQFKRMREHCAKQDA